MGLYNYSPNAPAAVVAVLSSAAVATVYLWQFSRNLPWHFWAMPTGIIRREYTSSSVGAKLTCKQWNV